MSFELHSIKTTGSSFRTTYEELKADNDRILSPSTRWGAFEGLFGLATNEFFLVTCGDNDGIHDRISNTKSVEGVRSLTLEPTVRPANENPRTREGLYVFRFFGVNSADIDEIATLSRDAWVYFENAANYQAEPQALFCELDRAKETGIMLLVTWYDGLNSWQASRTQVPEAAGNFRRRANLTHYAKPYATRLLI